MQEKLPCKQIITSAGSESHTAPKLEVKWTALSVVWQLNLSLALPGANGVIQDLGPLGGGGFSTTRGRN